MTDIKNKLKRIGFKLGISAMTFFPAKSAAQEFVHDTATNTVSVRTELVSKNANIVNTSSVSKDIIFYNNARKDTLPTKQDSLGQNVEKNKSRPRRDMVTLYPNRRPKTITDSSGTQYVLLAAAIYKQKNKYEFNTDALFDKYRKLVISIFTELRELPEDEINIEVTYCGPFELIIEYHYGDAVAAVCRNAYTGIVMEKNRENKIRLFKDMETNEYVIGNGNRRRTLTNAEAFHEEHAQMTLPENNMYGR